MKFLLLSGTQEYKGLAYIFKFMRALFTLGDF